MLDQRVPDATIARVNAIPGTPAHDALLAAFRARVDATIAADIAREEAAAEVLRAAVVPVVRAVVARARDEGVCRRVWLFGSFAWGQPSEGSDIDLLVEGDEDELAYRVGAATLRAVHALDLDAAPASLRDRCTSDGVAL